MTLSLYFARRFLWNITQVFLIFFGILLLVDTIDQLRRFSDADIGLARAGRFALLNVPESLYRILPLILVMGAIVNFLGLARSSELVVVRAAGRSGLRFLLTPLLVAILLGVVTIALFNPLVAATSKRYDAERAALEFAAAAASVPGAVTAETAAELRRYWDDGEIVEITGVVALFGFLNRWNDAMATELEAPAAADGRRWLAPQG